MRLYCFSPLGSLLFRSTSLGLFVLDIPKPRALPWADLWLARWAGTQTGFHSNAAGNAVVQDLPVVRDKSQFWGNLVCLIGCVFVPLRPYHTRFQEGSVGNENSGRNDDADKGLQRFFACVIASLQGPPVGGPAMDRVSRFVREDSAENQADSFGRYCTKSENAHWRIFGFPAITRRRPVR